MHNAAAAALDLDVVYLPLPVAPGMVEDALRGLKALGFLGANVTVPHKQAVIPFLERIDPAARALGAVNTIRITPVSDAQSADSRPQSPILKLHGFNTDWSGFLADLRRYGITVQGRSCLVLGAGGAARAVAYALAKSGGSVTVFARRPAQAEELVADLQGHLHQAAASPVASLQAAPWTALPESRKVEAPLIVNSTPVGMHPQKGASPWPDDLAFPPGSEVYDLIYNPPQTRLMQQAWSAGCRTENGLGMLIQQGALAFEIWTGLKPPLEVMAAALREAGVG
jgi:shikimate dehydrogenase